MTAHDDGLAAFQNERVAARRLARAQGMTEAQALQAVLAQAAARAGLADVAALLAARQRATQQEQQRRAAKAALRHAEQLARKARREPAAAGWRAWFDGSATPNPGLIGIGALLCGPRGERIEISRRAGHGGSSDAEYLALIAVLEAALSAGATPLTVSGDSQVIIGDVGAPGAAAKGMATYRTRVRNLMAEIGAVTLCWVPRHRNGDADRLSQQAIRSNPDAAVTDLTGISGTDAG
ncbi:MAG: ribonuclease HI family protein [Burkholderiaceae bacterium]|nr:ribonuclease HI family protein [Burkholderiaceae bacterium]